MRKTLIALVAVVVMSLSFGGTAVAQDDDDEEVVIGTVTAQPMTVSAAGEQIFSASGTGFIADSSLLLVGCTSPADPLVPGVSGTQEVATAAGEIIALVDCNVMDAVTIAVEADGTWQVEFTGDVGENFFLSAGALDGSQAGAVWIPIVPSEEESEEEAVDEPVEEEAEGEAVDEAVEEEVEEEEAAEPVEEEAEEEAVDEPVEEEAVEEEAAEEEDTEPELAETGVETSLVTVIGVAILGAGVLVAREGRRFRP